MRCWTQTALESAHPTGCARAVSCHPPGRPSRCVTDRHGSKRQRPCLQVPPSPSAKHETAAASCQEPSFMYIPFPSKSTCAGIMQDQSQIHFVTPHQRSIVKRMSTSSIFNEHGLRMQTVCCDAGQCMYPAALACCACCASSRQQDPGRTAIVSEACICLLQHVNLAHLEVHQRFRSQFHVTCTVNSTANSSDTLSQQSLSAHRRSS
jgi:hypothetical protein